MVVIKAPKLTKTDVILMYLNRWDPLHIGSGNSFYYQVDAEEIAQSIRKNSKLESAEKAIRKTIAFHMELEHKDNEPFDEAGCRECAYLILAILKNMR